MSQWFAEVMRLPITAPAPLAVLPPLSMDQFVERVTPLVSIITKGFEHAVRVHGRVQKGGVASGCMLLDQTQVSAPLCCGSGGSQLVLCGGGGGGVVVLLLLFCCFVAQSLVGRLVCLCMFVCRSVCLWPVWSGRV